MYKRLKKKIEELEREIFRMKRMDRDTSAAHNIEIARLMDRNHKLRSLLDHNNIKIH